MKPWEKLDARIVLAHAAGVETIEDLMERFGASRPRILRAFERQGLEPPPRRNPPADPGVVAPMLAEKTMSAVAAELGKTRRQVLRAAAKAGVRRARGRPTRLDLKALAALVAEELPWKEIGRRLGCRDTTAMRAWARHLRSSAGSAGC